VNYSVAITERVNTALLDHLCRRDGQEDLCFALWNPSRGQTRTTALIHQVILPEARDRQVHGNASFNPRYVERALDAALATSSGLAFLHSHPASGWQDMSQDDVHAELRLAPTVQGATGLPLVGLTLGAHDCFWSARAWEHIGPKQYRRVWAQSVRIVGEQLRAHFCDQLLKRPIHQPTQARTIAAWGPDVQARISRLRVGVVGLGSVGSIVAEALARTGIQSIQLLDYQALEEVNLDRTLLAYRKDVGRPKVEVAGKLLRKSATAQGFTVDADQLSICEDGGYRKALDCDVIFSCVDRPWARSVLNFLAYTHLIPVVDGGIIVTRTRQHLLRGADWKAHVVGPGHRCMLCLGQYDPGLVASDRKGDLDDPRYLESLPDDHPARANENVFGFSLAAASLEIMQWLMLVVGPLGLGPPGPQNYHLLTGQIDIGSTECDVDCVFPDYVATGDEHHAGTGVHLAAETARGPNRMKCTWPAIGALLRSAFSRISGGRYPKPSDQGADP
jgi:hypothetical protein